MEAAGALYHVMMREILGGKPINLERPGLSDRVRPSEVLDISMSASKSAL